MISEMLIKGKNSFNLMMVYQGETGAIREAQPFVVEFAKNRLCLFFDVLSNAQDYYGARINPVHECDCGAVAASILKERVHFIQHILEVYRRGFSR